MLACCVSCFAIAATTLLKIEESLSRSFAEVASSFAICTWICLPACSSLGLSGPGDTIVSFIREPMPSEGAFCHLDENCDIRFFAPSDSVLISNDNGLGVITFTLR